MNTYMRFYARPERDSRVIINICRTENCLSKKSCREVLIVHFMPKVFFLILVGFGMVQGN